MDFKRIFDIVRTFIFENREENMKKITTLTFLTSAMFLLSAQAVYAENAPAETTEATTVAPVENNADNHENDDRAEIL